ncbi:MAG TPA: ABC transporter permease, partial [Cyclobacteriaceae bacterium]|nr:ABC transporter permease [Cyclobacteriaceae bacterium]
MLRHYLITALRNLLRNRFYSAITITGLAVGVTAVFFIAQYLKLELSYDSFHQGAENIYRIAWINTNPQTRTPHPMAQAMVQDFPEVENAVSLSPLWGPGLTRQTFSIRNPEKDVRYDESNVLAVDSTFFKVFSFEVVGGDARTVLKNPGGILLSESTALKYFGSTDVVGKQLEVNRENNLVQILGVFKDVPQTSHFHFDILVPLIRLKLEDPDDNYYTWDDFGHYNYVRLKPGTDAKALETKLLDWSRKYVTYRDEDMKWLKENNFGFQLQPLTSIHLQSHIRWELEPNGNIAYVYLMAAAAVLILVVGAVNFVNLNMAQASERMKEIGVRKSLGAFRKQLAFQFLGESLLVTFISILFATLLIEVAVPIIQALTGRHFLIDRLSLILFLLPLGVIISLIAGGYPAVILSSARPALILKNKLGSQGLGARKLFIVFQFIASMSLISASVIITQQVNFLRHKDLGFKPEEVIVLPIKDRSINRRMEALRTELLKVNGVTGVSAASNIPGKSFNQNPIYAVQDPEERRDASEAMIDVDFLKVMSMTLAEGRGFLRNNPADSSGFILNETAINQLGIKNPIGKEIVWERDGPLLKGPIIGVVKDFHFQSLHEPLRPLLMRLEPNYNFAVIKINTADFESVIKRVEKTWRQFDDRFRFEFSFLDAQLNLLYREEQNIVSVLDIFSLLGVGIASMGLLGMAALAFRQRTKEVSIRKVMGASLVNLIVLLIKDFTQLVLVAVVLAVPLVWWL